MAKSKPRAEVKRYAVVIDGVEVDDAPKPARSHRTVSPLLALTIAAVACAAVWIVVLALWTDGVFAFTFDDAFYYFGIARNVAGGHGSTFDQINSTNGYHPLWLAICVLPYRLGLDDMGAARFLLILQLVIGWAATLAIVAAIVSRAVDDWSWFDRGVRSAAIDTTPVRRWATATLTIVFVLVAANPFIVKAFVNGLESGVAVTLYALLLLLAVRTDRFVDQPLRWRLGVGALLSLIFLARTDAAFLLACLGLWCVAEAVRGRSTARPLVGRLVAVGTLFVLPALTMAAYLAANQAAFDTPVQVSGLVKRAPLGAATLVPFVAVVAIAAAGARHAYRRAHGLKASRPPRFPLAAAFTVRTGWFAAFGLIVVGYYNLLQTQQWLWYYCPVLLYLLILLLLAVADIIGVAVTGDPSEKRATNQEDGAVTRSGARRLVPVLAVVAVPLLVGFAIETQSFVDPNLLSIQQANRDAGHWMHDNLPADAVVASWDAGVVGYYADRHVVNIDGVVNSLAYYRTMGDGSYTAFLRCERVGYIVNHGTDDGGRDPDIDKLIADLYGRNAAESATVIERVPFTYSGTTNNGGFELGDTHHLAVHVYEIPDAFRGPRPNDRC
jgi:hypothetical protein